MCSYTKDCYLNPEKWSEFRTNVCHLQECTIHEMKIAGIVLYCNSKENTHHMALILPSHNVKNVMALKRTVALKFNPIPIKWSQRTPAEFQLFPHLKRALEGELFSNLDIQNQATRVLKKSLPSFQEFLSLYEKWIAKGRHHFKEIQRDFSSLNP